MAKMTIAQMGEKDVYKLAEMHNPNHTEKDVAEARRLFNSYYRLCGLSETNLYLQNDSRKHNSSYASENITLKRIPRNKAKAAYNNGLDVLFIPVNCNPISSYYNLGIWENKNLEGHYSSFESLCNAFECYNCNNETGKYIAFYIKVQNNV